MRNATDCTVRLQENLCCNTHNLRERATHGGKSSPCDGSVKLWSTRGQPSLENPESTLDQPLINPQSPPERRRAEGPGAALHRRLLFRGPGHVQRDGECLLCWAQGMAALPGTLYGQAGWRCSSTDGPSAWPPPSNRVLLAMPQSPNHARPKPTAPTDPKHADLPATHPPKSKHATESAPPHPTPRTPPTTDRCTSSSATPR